MAERPVIVVKIGSNSLVDAAGRLDDGFMAELARQLAALFTQGMQPVVVTSGAVAAGLGLMGMQPPAPSVLSERQALAAIGQADLIHRWQLALARHGRQGAQILLSSDDFDHRHRYLNLSAALRALFEHGVVPIINENDSVWVAELALGDNDRLSALVAIQLEARRLILLTDVDGYYDGDPRQPGATLIQELNGISAAALEKAGGGGSRGTGGMRSKLLAARLATRAGIETVITRARTPDVLTRLAAGEALGTRVLARAGDGRPSSKRRWLALARGSKGRLILDDGAVRALVEKGRSLLPVGIRAVEGTFRRGDTVALCDGTGREIAHGLAGMDAAELTAVQGLRLDVAAERLGYVLPKTAVHRDNVLLVE